MRTFDYSFLKKYPLDAGVFDMALKLGALMERTRILAESNSQLFEKIGYSARMQSVRDSNLLEEVSINNERLEQLFRRSSAPVGPDEKIIAGHRDALDYVFNNYHDMEINEETVKELHRRIVSYTSSEGGAYRTGENLSIAINYENRREVRFTPVTSQNTEESMKKLMLALGTALHDGEINRLLLIPCFIIDFLSVRPFPDGNGRMSRLLTTALFLKSGVEVPKYVSFEGRLISSKMDYFRTMQECTVGWSDGTNHYLPFIRFYLKTLVDCYNDLVSWIGPDSRKKMNKANRVGSLIFESSVPVSKREIQERLPDISQPTIESVLSKMLKDGKIEKIGSNKSAKYRKAGSE